MNLYLPDYYGVAQIGMIHANAYVKNIMESWTFSKGQRVVCIDPSPILYCKYPLSKGKVYVVDGNYTCECGSKQIAITERTEVLNMICGCSRESIRRQTYYNWRFIPLDLLTNIISKPAQKKAPKELTV